MCAMDINKTGYVSRTEYVKLIQSLCESVPLASVRKVMNFLDNHNTGRIVIIEFLKFC
jgi:Ca2+-binding EF-hand superfamily protein